MPDHYFSTDDGELELRSIDVELSGTPRRLLTARGVFSGDGLDTGTAVLLGAAPTPPAGDLLDLGCGWGPIALTMALEAPEATVWAVDVNPKARELVRRNAELLSLSNVNAVAPEDVPEAIRFSAIWSNPPIRIGKAALHELLEQWLPRLTAEGAALLVVQKHLGADSLQRWIDERFAAFEVERASSKKTFRVLRVAHNSIEPR